MATVIVGAGIIGTATAYYLSRSGTTPPSDIHLIEACPDLFASASGYAAGFLARDFYFGRAAELGELSFDLHRQLATENKGAERWGYSRSTGASLAARSGKRGDEWLHDGTSRADAADARDFVRGKGPAWLTQPEGSVVEMMGEEGRAAQVDPLRLCKFLLSECLASGVQLHHPARPISVTTWPSGAISGLTIQSSGAATTIPCSRILLAAGAWTPHVFKTLFPHSSISIPITSLAGHSLLLRSPRWNVGDELLPGPNGPGGVHAVFTTDDAGYSPEIFSRCGGEIYLAGLNSASMPLPDLPHARTIDRESVAALRATARRLLAREGMADDLAVLREGLCFRPVTTGRAAPVIARVAPEKLGVVVAEAERGGDGGVGGVWIAAGHGPWGISWSLGTGKVVSEMLEGRKTSANVSDLGL